MVSTQHNANNSKTFNKLGEKKQCQLIYFNIIILIIIISNAILYNVLYE